MLYTVELGVSNFQFTDSEIDISLKTTTKLLFSSNYSDITGSNKAFSDLVDSGAIFVTPASETQLYIHIKVQSCTVILTPSVLTQVERAFRDAKLWLNTGLLPVHKEYKHRRESEGHIAMSMNITLNRTINTLFPASLLRIPLRAIDTQDARPPDGIPTASISSIEISLETVVSNPETVMKACSPALRTDSNDVSTSVSKSEIAKIPKNLSKSRSAFSQNTWQTMGSELLEEHAGQEDYTETTDCQLLPRKDLEIGQHICRLIDTAFRSLMTSNFKVTRGIKCTTDTTRKLPQIAPAMFRCGYSDAINHRNIFIPQIARAATSILKKSKNVVLQKKLSLLEESYWSQCRNIGLTPPVTDTRAMVKTFLWRVAQRGLQNLKPSRGLNPLEFEPSLPETIIDGVSRLDSILEETNYGFAFDEYLDEEMDFDIDEIDDLDEEMFFSSDGEAYALSVATLDDPAEEHNGLEYDPVIDDNADSHSLRSCLRSESPILKSDNFLEGGSRLVSGPCSSSSILCSDVEMLTSDPINMFSSSPMLCALDSMSIQGGDSCTDMEEMIYGDCL
ncbi:hypothetical protein ASPZODRAFT_726250 [Penicilliopsis zonata CBS 506.65]|uniref:Uncharacterized protein n=1 Tax=Penicilliopsis zonata CBS 506.65 TaxID=1073090 RepID=A0A1L9SCB2_9EURO|nr:hypothetical protein ASPZODRAFT_726250 [Penicilliopsis zonata CBS 506.65]OJJ44737.1 hypothetical protein ASPZODRAFT_726250 [Penicilliopsis zonata CBS 506.65]